MSISAADQPAPEKPKRVRKPQRLRWSRPDTYRGMLDGAFLKVDKHAPGCWWWSASDGVRIEDGTSTRLEFAKAAAIMAADVINEMRKEDIYEGQQVKEEGEGYEHDGT